MKQVFSLVFLFGLFFNPGLFYAQEEDEINVEESAEVFLEVYSDAFQENFFEALKQKGIENYDRAINLLLECKLLDPTNVVVDHELAKAYHEDKQYISAQTYAIEALIAEPENLWFLDTLMKIIEQQGSTLDMVKTSVPFENNKLKENLALYYFKQKSYEEALAILKDIETSAFVKDLTVKINDSIKKEASKRQPLSFSTTNDTNTSNPIEIYKSRMNGLMGANNLLLLEQLSKEALESYPSQPYFYYARGFVLNKKSKHKEAIEILESALDYLLDDISLANKIYQELYDAYTAIHHTSKANMYLRKIKPGF